MVTTKCRMPSRLAMNACRRDCGRTPFRASIRIMARSAVEAPVAMLRVYCSRPGGGRRRGGGAGGRGRGRRRGARRGGGGGARGGGERAAGEGAGAGGD